MQRVEANERRKLGELQVKFDAMQTKDVSLKANKTSKAPPTMSQEPPKLSGSHAPVLVSKTSDGYACPANNLIGSVRVSRGPRINTYRQDRRIK
jgi:hypothetical protein